MSKRIEQRAWLKSCFNPNEEFTSDQQQGVQQPPLTKGAEDGVKRIALPEVTDQVVKKKDILQVINDRVSHRKFTQKALTLEELSFLLWTTQGVKSIKGDHYATMRTVPSAGARHPFETYLGINAVEGLEQGIYQYLPLTHELVYLYTPDHMKEALIQACRGQKFAGECAVTFMWSVIPYRGEWRYNHLSHKPMLIDAGHICQNLYLACEAVGCGTCAIAAYDQQSMDKLLKLDGEEEFVVYVSPVGRVE